MFYTTLLVLHSILRWVVVASAVFALWRAYSGWLAKKPWEPLDDRAGVLYTGLFDLQLLVGIILYFFSSPITAVVLQSFNASMANSVSRFYGLEHITVMTVAVLLAHVGRAMTNRGESAQRKHRAAAVWYTISLLLVIAAIPWPFLTYGRPWIRLR